MAVSDHMVRYSFLPCFFRKTVEALEHYFTVQLTDFKVVTLLYLYAPMTTTRQANHEVVCVSSSKNLDTLNTSLFIGV